MRLLLFYLTCTVLAISLLDNTDFPSNCICIIFILGRGTKQADCFCSNPITCVIYYMYTLKKGKRKVHGVPQSQTAALPHPPPIRPQEEEETDKSNKHNPNKRTKSTQISSLFPKRGNRNTKGLKNTRTKWHTERHTTNRLAEQTTKQQRVRLTKVFKWNMFELRHQKC